MPYELIENDFWETYIDSQPNWVKTLAKNKIDEIRELENPRSMGGQYRGKWAYPTGKIQILATIDDELRQIILVKLLRLP